jgi:hypothetical protein
LPTHPRRLGTTERLRQHAQHVRHGLRREPVGEQSIPDAHDVRRAKLTEQHTADDL